MFLFHDLAFCGSVTGTMVRLRSNQEKAKVLQHVFSKKMMQELACQCKTPAKLNEIIKATIGKDFNGVKKLYELFDYFYSTLVSEYRTEYVYKNAIASKIVKGRHRLKNVSFYSEFRVRDSIADCVIANGETTSYEIKTEYDSFKRLEKQLSSYRKVFDKIFLVVSESKIKNALSSVSDDVGVLVLSDKYTLSEYRSAKSQIENHSYEIIFDCLRKKEYEKIIIKHFGELPNAKPVLVRDECRKMFSTLSRETISEELLKSLRGRRSSESYKELALAMPESLTSISMTLDISHKQKEQLIANMNLPISVH